MTELVKIYHNPACGTSRNTLALIRHAGIEPIVIEYLQTPPSKDELIQLIKDSNLTVREAIRKNVDPYKDLEIEQDHWTDEQLIDFMVQYPILINRPFVVTPKGTRLCRLAWSCASAAFDRRQATSRSNDQNGRTIPATPADHWRQQRGDQT